MNIRLLSTSRATFSGIVAKLGLVCKVTCTQAFCPLKSILHFYRAACPCYLSSVNFLHQQSHQVKPAPSPPASNQPPSIAKRQSFVSRAELLFFQGHSTIFFFLPNISLFAFLHLIVKQNSTVKYPQKEKHVHQRH